MPFNNNRNGFQNEDDFVKKMHNKKINELDFDLQLFINDIFESNDENEIIYCFKNALYQKTPQGIGTTRRIFA